MNLYVYFGAAIVFLLAVGSAYIKGGNDRESIVKGEYAARDLADERDNQASYAKWNERNRAKEKALSSKIASAAKIYQEDLAHVSTEKDRALEQLRTGALQLRLTNSTWGEACRGSSGDVAGSGRSDFSTPRGEFLGEADSIFLVGLAAEADTVALQLAACQAVIRADRE